MSFAGRSQSGFSLAGVLVATGILGASLTAANGFSSMKDKAGLVRDGNELLHGTLAYMSQELAVAGRLLPDGGIPIPSGAGAAPIVRPSPDGTALQFPTAWNALPAVIPGDAFGPRVNKTPTDVLTFLVGDVEPLCDTATLGSRNLAHVAPDGSEATVDEALTIDCGETGITAGDLIMFRNDAGEAALQMVTGVEGRTIRFAAGDPMHLNQPDAAKGTLLRFRNKDRSYPELRAFRVSMISYYVDTTATPARPRLMRRVNLRDARLIANGIENFQVAYDLVNGAANVASLPESSASRIRRATVFLSGRSRRPVRRSEEFLHMSMSTQVALLNPAFHTFTVLAEKEPQS